MIFQIRRCALKFFVQRIGTPSNRRPRHLTDTAKQSCAMHDLTGYFLQDLILIEWLIVSVDRQQAMNNGVQIAQQRKLISPESKIAGVTLTSHQPENILL